jgi:glucose-1-phosphate adenylyltransferase
MLKEDAKRRDSSHDFGKDIIPRMVSGSMRAFAYPFESYWVDVGTVEAYWQTHMDLLKHPPPLDLNDRTWVVHTQSEERPPVTIQEGAVVKDSMITDGCVISAGARIERCVLSPGVRIGKNAIVRDSVILTDSVVEEGARVDRAILDKAVRIGRRARVGQRAKPGEGPGITTIGKNAQIPDRIAVRRGAVIDADATPEYFSASALRQRQRARRLRIAAAASGASAPPQR